MQYRKLTNKVTDPHARGVVYFWTPAGAPVIQAKQVQDHYEYTSQTDAGQLAPWGPRDIASKIPVGQILVCRVQTDNQYTSNTYPKIQWCNMILNTYLDDGTYLLAGQVQGTRPAGESATQKQHLIINLFADLQTVTILNVGRFEQDDYTMLMQAYEQHTIDLPCFAGDTAPRENKRGGALV